jgi:DNA-3-methyladenine glycosylase
VAPALLHKTPPLAQKFYGRSALTVAKDLLGKVLVTGSGRSLAAGLIIEVEAYLGSDDPASHAFRGKTARNSSMFQGGGIAYVYLSYGMHRCVNVVTGREGEGEAVLLRALWPLEGQELMAKRRGLIFSPTPKVLGNLTSGPGKLTQAMSITLKDNGRHWDQGDFKIIDLGYRPVRGEIMASPRIGITKGVELPWRYVIAAPKTIHPKAKPGA